jgi:hypothetical protein
MSHINACVSATTVRPMGFGRRGDRVARRRVGDRRWAALRRGPLRDLCGSGMRAADRTDRIESDRPAFRLQGYGESILRPIKRAVMRLHHRPRGRPEGLPYTRAGSEDPAYIRPITNRKSSIANPSIDNLQSPIRQSTVCNRQSVNRQSAIANRATRSRPS